jgi:hypothetical protein
VTAPQSFWGTLGLGPAKNRNDEVDGFDRLVIGGAGGPLHSGLGSAVAL